MQNAWWETWPTSETSDEEIAAHVEEDARRIAIELLTLLRDNARAREELTSLISPPNDMIAQIEAKLTEVLDGVPERARPRSFAINPATFRELSRCILARQGVELAPGAVLEGGEGCIGTKYGLVELTSDESVPFGEVRVRGHLRRVK